MLLECFRNTQSIFDRLPAK